MARRLDEIGPEWAKFRVPGSGAWLLLAFAGPDGPLGPAMRELFEAIAGTLRWAG